MSLRIIRMISLPLLFMPVITGCLFKSEEIIRIVQRVQLDNSWKLYLFHRTDFRHESSETYFAIVQDSCSLFTDSTTVFANTVGYAQVDSISRDTLFISSQFEVNAGPLVNRMKIKVRSLQPQDKLLKPGTAYIHQCN